MAETRRDIGAVGGGERVCGAIVCLRGRRRVRGSVLFYCTPLFCRKISMMLVWVETSASLYGCPLLICFALVVLPCFGHLNLVNTLGWFDPYAPYAG